MVCLPNTVVLGEESFAVGDPFDEAAVFVENSDILGMSEEIRGDERDGDK